MSNKSRVHTTLSPIALAKSREFGARLKTARHRREWSLAECCSRSGVAVTTLKALEKGSPSVGWGYYLALLQLYGMTSEVDGLCHSGSDPLLGGVAPLGYTHEKVKFDEDL